MRNILKNLFYQVIFQLTKILIPIITVPIVSGALGPQGIGVYNYTSSIAQYFVLIAGLGVSLYGNREVALAWNKKKDISKIFWEIFFFKGLSTVFVLIIYLFLIVFFNLNNSNFLLIQSLVIIAVFFDVSWFFMGIEDFKKTSLSNLLVQLITLILIILFVKQSDDALIYTLIQTGGILLSQVIVCLFLRKHISRVRVNFKDIISHFYGAFEFLIPQIAITLYTNLNKTILGIVLGTAAVGYFSNSLQLNNVFITMITTLDVVLLPHMSGLFATNKNERIVQLMGTTIHLQLFLSIPIMFGVLTIYDKLVPWFFGGDFLFLNRVIPWFSLLIVIVPLGMAISRQYLMPIGKIKEYNKSVLVGAGINIVSNILLLPTIGFFGVVVSNILAEVFVTLIRTISFLKSTQFRFDFKRIMIFIIASIIMCLVTRVLTFKLPPTFLTNVIQMLIAVAIYFLITALLKSNLIVEMIRKRS